MKEVHRMIDEVDADGLGSIDGPRHHRRLSADEVRHDRVARVPLPDVQECPVPQRYRHNRATYSKYHNGCAEFGDPCDWNEVVKPDEQHRFAFEFFDKVDSVFSSSLSFS